MVEWVLVKFVSISEIRVQIEYVCGFKVYKNTPKLKI